MHTLHTPVDRCFKKFFTLFSTTHLNLLFAWIRNEKRRIRLLKQVIICSQDNLRQWWFICVLTILRGPISHLYTDTVCSLGMWVIKSLSYFCEIVFYFQVCDALYCKMMLRLSVIGSQTHVFWHFSWIRIVIGRSDCFLQTLPLLCLSCDSVRNWVIRSEGIAKEIPAVTFKVLIPITSPSCWERTSN